MPPLAPSARNLLIRTLSACVLVPTILVLVSTGRGPLLVLVLLIVGRATWEFYQLALRAGRQPCRHLGLVLSIGLSLQMHVFGTRHLAAALIVVAGSVFAAALRHGTAGYAANALLTLGGVIYVGLLGSAPLLIAAAGGSAQPDPSGWLLAVLFACIWLTDTTAYLVGRSFGRRKLAPSISPGKTVVGFCAGLAGGLAPVALYPLLPSFGIAELLGLLFVVSLAGQLGDLVESALKRDLGVKDAPALIPGHGGALDRFDSYLFAFPAAYLYIHFAGML